MSRINDKIKELEKFLEEFKTIMPSSLEEYKSSLLKKAACERYTEKIVEALVDLAFLTIKYKKLRLPEDDTEAFTILLENKLISEELTNKLKNAKGMRNIIAHEYGRIDDEIVFEAATEQLEKDAREFVKMVKTAI